jgi:hypothetical protein
VSVSNRRAQEADGQFLLRRYRDRIFTDEAAGGCQLFGGLHLARYVAGIDPLSAVVFVAIGLAVYGIVVILRQF